MLKAHLKIFWRQWGVLVLLPIITLVLLAPAGGSDSLLENGLLFGDVLYPPVVGWVTAGVILGDKNLELLLTCPRPLWHIYLHRLTLSTSIALICWLTLWVSLNSLASQFSPIFFTLWSSSSLSILFFATLGSMIALGWQSHLLGGIFLSGVWAISLIFQEQLTAIPWLNPFLTYQNPQHEWLGINRLFFTGFSVLFFIISLRPILTPSEQLFKRHEALL